MTADQILVTVVGVLAVGGVASFFLLPKGGEARTTPTSSGFQQAMILVKGAYDPARIVAEAGTPIRLLFRRDESSTCSEQVVFPDFHTSAVLPEGRVVPIELPAAVAGEYPFHCGMAMLRGTLVVR